MLGILKKWFGSGPEDGEGSDPIPCREALIAINEYMDGELEETPHEQVAEHFRVCARCYPHLKMEENFRRKVRDALERPEVPDDLRARVLDILADEPKEG